ncbi:MAG: high-affinity branched-chain amino acid ABC transporter permease LivM [Alphaproteobacteria bacterium]|nr:high-affinity branched-chain amino acid ABC transporter permease LivM [Alphaproteobacteria bacterium]MBU0795913.1 high-affinity branched-chain amino acid ABC transporter permease LivM [Alphaproteobacteria bacterium]MBU0886950.1 high-affinity branched-chain amino acid ABC transporter permease LivM [Alphaproteobacteria bacterium]MBU1813194.1 high-affinity branched-chain amino acid ABC transporter permease LivM [Alphaproteobacteria bacterium]MBU2090752.1 high-affinity branched-chain amino acid 
MAAGNVRTAEGALDLPAILKDCLMSALVVFALAAPIIGLRTIDTPGGLGIDYRFDDVALAVLAGFVGRLLVNIYWAYGGRRRPPAKVDAIKGDSFASFMKKVGLYGGPVAILFAVAMPAMPFADRYVLDVAILVLTYIMLGWGLNIVVGLAGLLDLGYVAFYAVGAYSYALIATYFGWSFWVCLPLAGVFACFFGIILGFPVLRLRGDYLAIVTLGFGEIIRVVLLNWYEFTGGPNGVSGIPRPSFFGLNFARIAPEGEQTFHQFFGLEFSSVHRIIFLYYLILALALITNFVTLRLRKLPIGRAWEALREDEIACRSLGINPTNTKLTAFAIGAMFGGFAGSFFATRQGFISPESFTFIESAVILAIVVLGGMGSQIGVVIAAIFLIGGTEVFRELEQYRMLAFGGAMVLIMVWKPRGLLAHREPTLKLPPTAKAEAKPLAGAGGAA